MRHVTEQALRSLVDSVCVVTGYEAEEVVDTLADLPVTLIHNPHYALGMAGSLKRGVGNLAQDADGVLVCLGDMPQVSSVELNSLIDAFSTSNGKDICIPTYKGHRGNPVLLGRQYFPQLSNIVGDVGARHLIYENMGRVLEVPMSTPGIIFDVDRPSDLSELRSLKS